MSDTVIITITICITLLGLAIIGSFRNKNKK